MMTLDAIICFAGLAVFGIWVVRTRWGTKALADSPPRRNCMPAYLPFAALFLWLLLVAAGFILTEKLAWGAEQWQQALIQNMIFLVTSILMTGVIILLARSTFARRLKGMGLGWKHIAGDLGAGFVNLLGIWPMVMLAFLMTIKAGELIYGPDFQMERHEELQMLTEHPQAVLKVIIAVTTIAVVPVTEELLFRGLFQTMIRSYITSAWGAILLTSMLFAAVHANAGHWPALFVLSLSMGYAYEKSGSLLRSVFIHLLFNASSIIATLYQ
jgi:membrane protease YdiL (CAAX protease family)